MFGWLRPRETECGPSRVENARVRSFLLPRVAFPGILAVALVLNGFLDLATGFAGAFRAAWGRLTPWALCLLLVACASAACAASDDYRVVFEGAPDKQLLAALRAASDSVQLRKRAPVAPPALRLRAERDRDGLLQVMRAHGYYAASIEFDIDADADPVRLVFRVEPGPSYLLAAVAIQQPDGARIGPADPSVIGLALGERARAASILASQRKLIQWFRRRGHPFPAVADRRVVVDHAERSVSVTFVVEPGPVATFGDTEIAGLERVEESVVRNELPWRPGDPFNGDLLTRAQSRIVATALFGVVQVGTADALDENGRVPIRIKVTERRHRTIGVGVSYRTDEGLGAKASWEHRNLLGRGERLGLSAAVSDIISAVQVEFRKPHFRRRGRTLLLDLRLAEDKPDAYTSRSIGASGIVKRTVADGMSVGAGLAYKYSEVKQVGEEEIFSLVSVPATFDWDTSNDWLSPSRGGRLGVRIAPFYDLRSADLGFVKGRIQYARYIALSPGSSVVLAGRVAAGSIVGGERETIPADERFYAGGGGSVRGYPFETLSPLEGTDPTGGKSLFELSIEVRIQLSDAVGLVPFVDAGNAFADSTPDLFGELFWAAGVGLRYNTPIGPIRFDVAFPLDRRDGIDDSFQIYLSLGQSF